MKTIKVLLLSAILLIATMLCTTPAFANMLPWLDFGSNVVWDSNTNTLTDGGFAYVNSLTYLNGSTVPPPFFPPSDGVLFNPVSFSISFDGNNSNDWISIGSFFSASLEVTGMAPDPLNYTPNPYSVKIESSGLLVNTGSGSQWADEFDSQINYSLLYPAQLNLFWGGSYYAEGNGLYKVNAAGKVAPVPEPGTLILLGTGLAGIGYYVRRRKK